jgi:molybdopterin-guanine dinucleotide biosynthesis protein
MSDKKIPVILITGYLGSGKTTLMQNLLKQEQRKIALIVNDMGSVNIDTALLNKNRDRIASVEMVELQNGCICCTLRDEFIAEIERISQLPDIEAVIVEASGISEPSNIAASFVVYTEDNPDTNVYLSSVVSVVDADRIYNEFPAVYEYIVEDVLGDKVEPPLRKHFHIAEVDSIKPCFPACLCAAVIELVVAAVAPARDACLVFPQQVSSETRAAGAYQLVSPHIC